MMVVRMGLFSGANSKDTLSIKNESWFLHVGYEAHEDLICRLAQQRS